MRHFNPGNVIKVRGKKAREGITTPQLVKEDYRDYPTKSVPTEQKLVGISSTEWEMVKAKVGPAWEEHIAHTEAMANRPLPIPSPVVQPTTIKPRPAFNGPIGVWSIGEMSILKGIKLDNPRPNPVTGKVSNWMPFAIPLLTIEVARSHWQGAAIVIKRNTKGQVKAFGSDDSIVPGLHGILTRARLESFFGKTVGTQLANMLEMGA